MKHLARFLLFAIALVSGDAVASPVPSTLGSNLTAYNGASGATNNNNWNILMNNRTGGANAPTADFGNCNALIMRCAQPKCATGGCTSMDVARPIVSGCVQSNESCKQYGNDLIEYISAQLVATSTAKANAQAAAAQNAAAQAAAQQSAQQLQQMQAQMQQMQMEMSQQNADTVAQLQSALEEQKQITAQAIADANKVATQTAAAQNVAANAVDSLTNAQVSAAESGVSADILAREQISGQIMSKLENAQTALKTLEATMNNTFEYAGCDKSGNNCAGPKRVKAFKNRAMQFFEPYNDVLDELYDALIMAQSLGVDITDIYMMLNGTCNAWAQYLCGPGQVMHYNQANCPDGRSVSVIVTGDSGAVRGGAKCEIGQVVPMSDGGCQLVKMLTSEEEVQRNWLYPDEGTQGGVQIRVGCASEALENSNLFRNRKKQAAIDIETLQRMIEQDAPAVFGGNRFGQNKSPNPDALKYCALNTKTYQELEKYVGLKQLPKKVCVPDSKLESVYKSGGSLTFGDETESSQSLISKCSSLTGYQYEKCLCGGNTSAQWIPTDGDKNGAGTCKCLSNEYPIWDIDRATCVSSKGASEMDDRKYLKYIDDGGNRKKFCEDSAAYGARWNTVSKTCDCSTISDSVKKLACETMTRNDIDHSSSAEISYNTNCALTGGTSDLRGNCICDGKIYSPDIQSCKQNMIGKKSIVYKMN